MATKFTAKAENALTKAGKIAEEFGHSYIGSEHLLLALSEDPLSVSGILLGRNGFNGNKAKEYFARYAGKNRPTVLSAENMTPKTVNLIENACRLATKCKSPNIGTEHLLSAISEDRDCMANRLLVGLAIDIGKLREETASYLHFTEQNAEKSKASSTPTLDKFGRDLVALAKKNKLDPLIGREDSITRALTVLCRKTKNNPLFLGEAGVGKTAIVEGIAQRIAAGCVPELIKHKRIVQIELGTMVSGTKYRGDFEERVKSILDEAVRNEDVILFIDEIHTLVGAGAAEGAIDAANIMKPELARGNLSLIGATTPEEYRTTIEKDGALARRFQPIEISPSTEEETVRILLGLKNKYEEFHHVSLSKEVLTACAELSARYIPERNLPDKAIDLLDETCSGVKVMYSENHADNTNKGIISRQYLSEIENSLRDGSLDNEEKKRALFEKLLLSGSDKDPGNTEKITVTRQDVIATLRRIAPGVTVETVETESDLPLSNESFFDAHLTSEQLLILNTVKRKANLKESRKTALSGCYLFSDGKRKSQLEFSRFIAKEIFGSERAVIVLRGSLYTEASSISGLIGSAPGYVGYDNGNLLTDKVRRHPYSLLFFDEIDKANPAVWNLLSQITENGELTDNTGKTVDFSHVILILSGAAGNYRQSGFVTCGAPSSRECSYGIECFDGIFSLSDHFKADQLVLTNAK